MKKAEPPRTFPGSPAISNRS